MAGTPGSQPTSLAPVIPGEDIASQVLTDVANAGRPAPLQPVQVQAEPLVTEPAPAPERAPAEDPLAALAASFSAPETASDEPAAGDPLELLAAEFGARPEPTQDSPSLLDQAANYGQDLVTRFKASFARTNEQKRQLLEQTYGAENVEQEGDDFYVIRNGKREKFTRGMWDLLKDVLVATNPTAQMYSAIASTFSGKPKLPMQSQLEALTNLPQDVASLGRDIAAEAVALPAELAGLAAAPATGGVSLAAGRFAGGVAGEAATDYLGQLLGVPDDPKLSTADKAATYLLVGGLRASLGWGADRAMRLVSKLQGKRAAQQLAEERAIDMIPEQSSLNMANEIEAANAAIKHLQDEGILDAQFKLRPDQATSHPILSGAARHASRSKLFQDMVENQGRMLYEAWEKLAEGAMKLKGSTPGLGERILKKASSSDQAFGSLIGEFRNRVIQEAPNAQISVPRTQRLFDDLFDSLGFKRVDFSRLDYAEHPQLQQAMAMREQLVPYRIAGFRTEVPLPGPVPRYAGAGQNLERPTPEQLADILEITSNTRERDAKFIIDTVTKLHDALVNNGGKLPAKLANMLYTDLTRRIGLRIGDANSVGYTRTLIQLKNAIRDDVAEGIGEVLGERAGKSYELAMQRYRTFREAEEKLGSILDRDAVTTQSLVKYVFSKGQAGLERIRAIKSILDNSSPDGFEGLKAAWFTDLVEDAVIRDPRKAARLGGYDWQKIENSIESLGDDMLKEIFTPKELKNLRGFLTVAKRMQRADFEYLAEDAQKRVLSRAISFLVNAIPVTQRLHYAVRNQPEAIPAGVWQVVSKLGPNEMAKRYLTEEGIESLLAMLPKRDAAKARPIFEQIIDASLGTARTLTTPLPGTVTAPLAGEIARGGADYIMDRARQPQAQ